MTIMTADTEADTATTVRQMARQYHVVFSYTATDRLAHHMTRLAGDAVELDEIEQLIIALQRAGHLTRKDAVHLTARYRREAKP
jgi:hypothetical protein